MAKSYTAFDCEYQFDDHRVGYGYTRLVAVNVKYRGPSPGPVSDEYQRKLALIIKHTNGQTEDTIRQWAEDDTREEWWEWAKERAQELKLGAIHSEGRSGGWLVLDNWPTTGIETTCESEQERCKHCDKEEDEHANEQCLFQATSMELVTKLHLEAREDLDNLTKYCDEMRASLEYVAANFMHNLEFQIDRKYEDLDLERDECEKVGQLSLWTLPPLWQRVPPATESTSEP